MNQQFANYRQDTTIARESYADHVGQQVRVWLAPSEKWPSNVHPEILEGELRYADYFEDGSLQLIHLDTRQGFAIIKAADIGSIELA